MRESAYDHRSNVGAKALIMVIGRARDERRRDGKVVRAKRAATLMPLPGSLSSSATMSPRLMPTRKTIRCSDVTIANIERCRGPTIWLHPRALYCLPLALYCLPFRFCLKASPRFSFFGSLSVSPTASGTSAGRLLPVGRSGSGNLNRGYEWNFRLNAA